VACAALQYFSTSSHKRQVKKKVIEHNGCFAFSINMPLVLRRTERDVIINVYSSSCKVPSYSFQFLFKQKFFSTYFFKNTQISNNIKICPVGAELIRADGRTDGRTDMTKLIVAFRNFANAPKSSTFFAHRVFMYFVWISEHTAISSNWLVFINKTERLYCAARPKCLTILQNILSLWKVEEIDTGSM